MARIRYLKPDFFKDEDLATLPLATRLFYAGLWGQADRAGRLEDRPLRLKVEIFPYDAIDVEKCLQELARPKQTTNKPFINRYEVDGQKYIQIVEWSKHQKPHHTEADSKIPPYNPPNITEKGMEKGSVHQASAELSNVPLTVKEPLTRFSKPTVEQIETYAKSIDFSLDGQQFFDFYESKGWKVGKTPMKCWKAAVRTWKTRTRQEKPLTGSELAKRSLI